VVAVTDRKEFRDLASPERAHDTIANLDLDPGTERIPLEDARGRILAERIDATIDVPGFDRASLDGYAVRGRDTFGADEVDHVALELVGAVHAGEAPTVSVGDGECVEISTGAVMPSGADAMVPVEQTDEGDGEILFRKPVAPGDNVMLSGADVAAGERALGPGTQLTPREIGLLSALGVETVPVAGRPTVGIVSTGDELVRPGDDLAHDRGQIHDVNSYTIASSVEEAGGDPRLYPHAGDDVEELERVLRNAAEECDLVLSSGSTSASAVDVVYRVIEDLGELQLHGVAVKPGKPMLVGTLEGGAYVGLPGYPVSALTIFRTFVAPAIRRASGLQEPQTATVSGTMLSQVRYSEGRRRFLPVGLVEDGWGQTRVYPVDKGSGATTSLVEADGVVDVDPDTEYLGESETVDVQLFSPDVRPPTVFGVGEDDPVLSRLLDRLKRPRYLAMGSREGLRRLRNGVPDVVVTAGPVDRDVDADQLGSWTRSWGLVVPDGNAETVEGVGDLVDRDLRLINRTTDSGLRRSLGNAVADLADERGEPRRDLEASIDGWDLSARAHESPPRKVAAGDADVGLGLRATATALGLGFVPLGEQVVRVHANPDRTGKSGVQAFEEATRDIDEVIDDFPGYSDSTGTDL
jgi:putative molybdopterin biosynthesis protein